LHAIQFSKLHAFAISVVKRVVVGRANVRIEIVTTKLPETLLGNKSVSNATADDREVNTIQTTTDFKPFLRRNELRFATSNDSCSEGTPIPPLLEAIARARDWYDMVVAGEVGTVGEIAHHRNHPIRKTSCQSDLARASATRIYGMARTTG
jgi:hypothetical protein